LTGKHEVRAVPMFAIGLMFLCAGGHAEDAAVNPPPPELIKRGSDLYAVHCATCHGAHLANPPWGADLGAFPHGDHMRFVDTVSNGLRGMPPWGDLLKPDDIEALWAYVVAGEPRK
jgi:mono/diheme cytochrome c family protein